MKNRLNSMIGFGLLLISVSANAQTIDTADFFFVGSEDHRRSFLAQVTFSGDQGSLRLDGSASIDFTKGEGVDQLCEEFTLETHRLRPTDPKIRIIVRGCYSITENGIYSHQLGSEAYVWAGDTFEEDNNTMTYDPPLRVFPRMIEIGDSYTFREPRGSEWVTLTVTLEAIETVQTPAGSFEAIRLRLSDSSDPSATVTQWYARNIGVIKGRETIDLEGVSARIDYTIDSGYPPLVSKPVIYPFSDSMSLGGGWRFSEWFDYFAETESNWIFHSNLGWAYYIGPDSSDIWLWLVGIEWVWTSKDVYPFVYDTARGTWLWFNSDSSPEERMFYNMAEGEWEIWDQKGVRTSLNPSPITAGNVFHQKLELYQGPMVWETGASLEGRILHVDPVLGRRAVLAASITHEVNTVPEHRMKILDHYRALVSEGLSVLADPITEKSAASDSWTTLYLYDLPGEFHQAAYQFESTIDPANTLDEPNEDDNVFVGKFTGSGLQRLRIKFIPIHGVPQGDPPAIDPEAYLRSIYDLFPIGDDYHAEVGDPMTYEGESWDQEAALRQLLQLWNEQADPDEYYQGIFRVQEGEEFCGHAYLGRPVSVIGNIDTPTMRGCPSDVSAHEFGHNLDLQHTPGDCGAENPDPSFPYEDAGIGPRRGWLFSAAMFINPDDGYHDIMSYCYPQFISDYNYQKAFNFRLKESLFAGQGEAGPTARSPSSRIGQRADEAFDQREPDTSLALTGTIDELGKWILYGISRSQKPPRNVNSPSDYTLSILDEHGLSTHREPLSLHPSSKTKIIGWAARVPYIQRGFVEISDPEGIVFRAGIQH